MSGEKERRKSISLGEIWQGFTEKISGDKRKRRKSLGRAEELVNSEKSLSPREPYRENYDSVYNFISNLGAYEPFVGEDKLDCLDYICRTLNSYADRFMGSFKYDCKLHEDNVEKESFPYIYDINSICTMLYKFGKSNTRKDIESGIRLLGLLQAAFKGASKSKIINQGAFLYDRKVKKYMAKQAEFIGNSIDEMNKAIENFDDKVKHEQSVYGTITLPKIEEFLKLAGGLSAEEYEETSEDYESSEVIDVIEKNSLKIKKFVTKLKDIISVGLGSEYRFKGVAGRDPIQCIISACDKAVDYIDKCKREKQEKNIIGPDVIGQSGILRNLEVALLSAIGCGERDRDYSFLNYDVMDVLNDCAESLEDIRKDLIELKERM